MILSVQKIILRDCLNIGRKACGKINSGTCNGLKNGQGTLKTSFNEKKNERSDFLQYFACFSRSAVLYILYRRKRKFIVFGI